MSEPKPAATLIVACAQCGANNRVAPARLDAGQAVCGRCRTTLALDPRPVVVTDANFADAVLRSPLPVLLDLWAPWCGPCRVVGPVVDQIAAETAGRARVGKLNVDDNPATAARFSVQSIPTLLIFKDGREIDRLVGAHPKETIRQRLARHLS